MFSNSGERKSVDSLSQVVSPNSHRTDFPFHRQGSTSVHSQRRGSTASSTHSTGGSLDTTSGSWAGDVLETGRNSISTLLQPPIVRTGLLPHTSAPASSAHKPPTARDIPPVTLTNIKHVDAAEFEPYLTQVVALYEQLRRVKESEDEAANIPHRRSSKTDEFAAIFDEGHLRAGKPPSASRRSSVSISSFLPIEAPSPIRRSSSGFARRPTQGPPPLSTIPNVYFGEDFHLENPRTFGVVSERSEVIRPPSGTLDEKASANGNAAVPRKALATNAILQEKLSWYMDTIEMHLIASISTASTTFFTALVSLRELHSEVADSVEKIKAFKQELEALDNEIVVSGLNVIQMRQRRGNLQQLHDAVLQLKRIIDGIATCESLVEDGEVEKALESIDSLEKLIAGEPDHSKKPLTIGGFDIQPRDLRGATALQGVNDDLGTLRLRIGKLYETRFLSLLTGDLRCHSEVVSTQEVLIRWTSAFVRSRGGRMREPSVFPSYMSSTDGLRSELLESLTGLHRAKHLTTAATSYREAALKEIRNLVRRPLPTSNDDDNESMVSSSTVTGRRQLSQQQKSTILARHLRALEPKDAEELLVKIYISVTETLRRLTTQVKLLLDVSSSLGDDCSPSRLRSPQMKSPLPSPTAKSSIAALKAQEIHKAIDLPNLLGQAIDVAQDKIIKLLRVRSEQSTHLSPIWFLRYFTLNLYFASECESISGRSGTTLNTVVNGQIKDFLQQHSDTEKQKLAQGMESDPWEAKDFSEKDTAELNRILSCSTKDPAEWSDDLKIWVPYSDDDPESINGADDPHPNGGGKTRIRNASIDDETFVLPSSAILCMDGISHFLQLIVGIPSMTSEIGASLVSYLQLFNSRCAELILGAGARRSAGLKNITSKHLVLASRALAFIATLISYVREFVRRYAEGGAAALSVVEFDKVKRLYQEHQNSIYDKLVEIMSRLAALQVKAMKTIDWDDGQKNVHPYMAALAKDTTSLHRILTKTLPEGTIRMLMSPVFISYKVQFGKAFQEVDPKTEFGRDRYVYMCPKQLTACANSAQYAT
ncbi:Vps54-like protein-domain-containing protein [Durotheca rogersii]|uniref:Vps54-like protein-domain-containing protein n=1 Tax=Durotheca rogersii TaxID=419775 RepID=UPI0022210B5D|nr:Vps54-like protein-domain-containing protein [Durotheca rogersii]KAI5856669.1 Vps54-like protein-domain-containing protein [Durotheca rogersii]